MAFNFEVVDSIATQHTTKGGVGPTPSERPRRMGRSCGPNTYAPAGTFAFFKVSNPALGGGVHRPWGRRGVGSDSDIAKLQTLDDCVLRRRGHAA